MKKLLFAVLKRISAFLIVLTLGTVITMLWVYQLPDEQLGSDRYDLARVKERVLVWWYQPHAFRVYVAEKREVPANASCKPNPLLLIVSVDENKRVKLNITDMGTLENSDKLKEKLKETFKWRLELRAYRIGVDSNTDLPEEEKIEKTIYLKADKSLKYNEVVKLIDELKDAGANPIGIIIDDVDDYPLWMPIPVEVK